MEEGLWSPRDRHQGPPGRSTNATNPLHGVVEVIGRAARWFFAGVESVIRDNGGEWNGKVRPGLSARRQGHGVGIGFLDVFGRPARLRPVRGRRQRDTQLGKYHSAALNRDAFRHIAAGPALETQPQAPDGQRITAEELERLHGITMAEFEEWANRKTYLGDDVLRQRIGRWTAQRKQAVFEGYQAARITAEELKPLHGIGDELEEWVRKNGSGGRDGRRRLAVNPYRRRMRLVEAYRTTSGADTVQDLTELWISRSHRDLRIGIGQRLLFVK